MPDDLSGASSDGGNEMVPELTLSMAWKDQAFEAPLATVDGRSVEVINRGVWTHGFGPDFREAMILFDGRELRTGSVEIHHRTNGWHHHGHDTDRRYDDVVLHVVHTHDGSETRRHDGHLVPVVEIGHALPPLTVVPSAGDVEWSRFGGPPCAPDLATTHPKDVRDLLLALGDIRLATKTAAMEALLTEFTPGEALYRLLCDGLGYRANRTPMEAMSDIISLRAMEALLASRPPPERRRVALGVLLGVAGFLPVSPTDAHAAQLESHEVRSIEVAWQHHGAAWHDQVLLPTTWTRARVRPANHPAGRLGALASILVKVLDGGGLVATLMASLSADQGPVQALRDLATAQDQPLLGADRASAIIANGIVPFAIALASWSSDTALMDTAASAWERLPASGTNEVIRRASRQVAGRTPLRQLGARGQQGLIHLDSTLCAPRRCYECPIAHRVLAESHTNSE